MDYLLQLSSDPTAWAAVFTLILMEVVLGIDNLIFISVLTNKLPADQRSRARRIGIAGALVLRLALLSLVAFIVKLVDPVLTLVGQSFSWKDIILIAGGLFLIWKASKEIHHIVDPEPATNVFSPSILPISFAAVIVQILVLDIVFSLDSIITAVGMTPHLPIMVIAVVITVLLMLLAAEPLANFINQNPTVVVLALGFLLMIGTTLVAEGFGVHFPKAYIYSAMAFSVFVEVLNMLSRRARQQNPSDSE